MKALMLMKALILMATLAACVDQEDADENLVQPAHLDPAVPPATADNLAFRMRREETIVVHSCSPGFLEVGEGDNATCIEDPSWGWGGGGGGFGGEERVPGGGPAEGGPGGCSSGAGGGCGGDPPPARPWKCNASCNVVQDDPGARCPDRVTGQGTATSQDAACRAATKDANSKVPRGCHKRHCDCRCSQR